MHFNVDSRKYISSVLTGTREPLLGMGTEASVNLCLKRPSLMLRVLEDNTVIEISLPSLTRSAAGFLPETRRDKKSALLAGSSKEQTSGCGTTMMEMG